MISFTVLFIAFVAALVLGFVALKLAVLAQGSPF
jgi:hypothetical protein